ncbi:MAG TPA: acyl-CoA thioesterase [Candidatus Thermoplasmatota archaeon]|nr:acyl-CoA thioesterase [Candidatus Thermoplasmatota archaeon]
MLPFLRLAKVLLRPAPKGATDALAGASVRFRTWPNDLDLNRHMNNSRYLALMDLGRYDLTRKVGLLQACRRNKWFPVVGKVDIRFRRSLGPFRSFTLHTRVLGWDEKRFWLEQRFLRGDAVVAEATVRAVFLSKQGTVPTATVLAAIGETRPSPDLANVLPAPPI